MRSLNSLRQAQSSRIAHVALPIERPRTAEPIDASLEAFRQRNAALDGLFYDIGCLSAEESRRLAPVYAAEGALLVVGPTARPSLDVFATLADLQNNRDIPKALAVAGVGSSALGSAAFARNIADAIDAPVLAVVSGYGLSDLLTEATGGFFLFGFLNAVRNMLEPLEDAFVKARKSHDGAATSRSVLVEDTVRRSRDVRILTELLEHGPAFDYLVGHSKGNLVISEALFALRDSAPAKLKTIGAHIHAITISAKIAFPREMKKVTDIIGALDGFGALNSRGNIATDILIPLAWHHTNTELPFSLSVTSVMARALGNPGPEVMSTPV